MFTLQSQRHVVVRSVSYGVSRIDPGAKVNSSFYCDIVLEKGLLPDIRAICRHYRWTLQQDGALAHTARTTMDYLKKSTSTSLNLTCGLQIELILIPWITLFGMLFSNESTIQYNKIQLNVLVPSLQKHGRLCITMSVNIWDNSYEEKAQLNKCDLSARLKTG